MLGQRFRAGHPLVLGLLAWASAAAAEAPARVVLFDRPDSDELGLELSARVRGELRAAGFEVVVLALPPHVEPDDAAETVARDLEPAAVVVLRKTGEPTVGGAVIELWIAGRRPASAHRERLTLAAPEPSVGIARFAVQVAELVKARLAELSLAVSKPARAAPPPRAATIPGESADHAASASRLSGGNSTGSAWVAGVAVGALADLSARDAALLPLLRAGVLLHAPVPAFDVELRATLGTFGRGVSVADGPLRAELDQSLGSLELGLRFAPGAPLQPVLFLGAGAYTVRASGVAPEGYETRSERAWSALGSVGTGLAYAPVQWLRWSVDVQLLAVTPPVVVRLAQREQPERGPWLALVSTGIAGVF